MRRILGFVLCLAFITAGQQPPQPQQPTIAEQMREYSVLKDMNVQVAAQNNSAFTMLNDVLLTNAKLQMDSKKKDSTITYLQKELDDLRLKVRKK